jgi:hypothetical protein
VTVIPDPPEGYEWKRPQEVKNGDEVLSVSGSIHSWLCEGFTLRWIALLAVRVRPKRIRQYFECDDTPSNRRMMERRKEFLPPPKMGWSYGPVEEVE